MRHAGSGSARIEAHTQHAQIVALQLFPVDLSCRHASTRGAVHSVKCRTSGGQVWWCIAMFCDSCGADGHTAKSASLFCMRHAATDDELMSCHSESAKHGIYFFVWRVILLKVNTVVFLVPTVVSWVEAPFLVLSVTMSRQLNLFGKPVPRRKPVYVSPKTKYEEFVNAFVLCNATLSLSDAKRQADDAWPHSGMPDHFKSLLQVLGRLPDSPMLAVDEGLPSLAGESVLCTRGCNMVCLSPAGQKRHDLLFHFEDQRRDVWKRRRRAVDDDEDFPAKKTWQCGYKDCVFTAGSQYQLRQHKDLEGHKLRQGRPRTDAQWMTIAHVIVEFMVLYPCKYYFY